MPVVVVVVAVADATSLVKCSAEVSSPRLARAGRLFLAVVLLQQTLMLVHHAVTDHWAPFA